MGQQTSQEAIPIEPQNEGESSASSEPPSAKTEWCSKNAAILDSAHPDRKLDSVIVSIKGDPGSESIPEVRKLASNPHLIVPRKTRPTGFGAFSCSFVLAAGPEVELVKVEPRCAAVRWTSGQVDARKFHIEVLRITPQKPGEPEAEPCEIAFFEAPPGSESFDLPLGTLERASGPYRIQVITETGTGDRLRHSAPGFSEVFSTPPEAPGAVGQPHLIGERETELQIWWARPEDDGGSPLTGYEVILEPPSGIPWPPGIDAAVASEKPEVRETLVTTSIGQDFTGLAPNTGPYKVEVRAVNAAGLKGPARGLTTMTAVAAPTPPVALAARLRQGWPQEARSSGDLDAVRLEFAPPEHTGGRAIESYLVFAIEENAEEQGSQDLTALVPLCEVLVSEAMAVGERKRLACDVAVSPNRSYCFAIEASNGIRSSGHGNLTAPVFVPARVPRPPSEPPLANRLEGGFAAELRWLGPLTAGGLPLATFKVGILGPFSQDEGAASESEFGAIQREVTISQEAAATFARDGPREGLGRWTLQPRSADEVLCGTRVDGLQADARYCFVLAASNALGTGCWSKPSAPVWTPVAAPLPPVNAVATITMDAQQQVVVTVTWDCPKDRPGGGALAFFHVCLRLSDANSSSLSSNSVSRIAAGPPGQRTSFTAPLHSPGSYVVEVVTENAAGQQSLPAVLSLEAPPEAFAALMPELQPAESPCWSAEPVLMLGVPSNNESLKNPKFGEVHAGLWFEAMLLWDEGQSSRKAKAAVTRMSSGSLAAAIDVVCHYRRPGSSAAHTAVLSSAVSTSRLQVALPTTVPMSLRLVSNQEAAKPKVVVATPGVTSRDARPPKVLKSEPLLLLLSENGERLRPSWETWTRQTAAQTARWQQLPKAVWNSLESAWLEGFQKIAFDLTGKEEDRGPAGILDAGHYELTFGDDRRVQHTLRKLGHGGWQSKARRVLLNNEGEEATVATAGKDDLCVVCMEQRRTHAFMHADSGDGHLAVCGNCAEAFKAEAAVSGASRAVKTCPMCRRPFNALHRIFQ